MDATSAPIKETSEFEHVGIEWEDAITVDVPRVRSAAACLECEVYDTIRIHENHVVFGSVKHISIHDQITTDGVIEMKKIDSVGRLGGPYYTGIDFLDVERHNFGAWQGPVPVGLTVEDKTNWLTVEVDEFEAVRDAVRRIESGESIAAVANDTGFDRTKLKDRYARRGIYLDAKADDERIEAALAEAGIKPTFTY